MKPVNAVQTAQLTGRVLDCRSELPDVVQKSLPGQSLSRPRGFTGTAAIAARFLFRRPTVRTSASIRPRRRSD